MAGSFFQASGGGGGGGGGGITVTEDTLATIEALSPTAGDLGFPTDSGYTLVGGNSGWLYQWDGYQVQKPPSSGWTLRNQGTMTQTTSGGVQLLDVPTGLGTDQRVTARAAATANAYVFGLSANAFGNDNQVVCGFYETATTKNIILTWRASGVSGAPDLRIQRHNSLATSSVSSPVDIADNPSSRQARFVKLAWSGTTLSWSVGPTAFGPWQEIHSEAEGSFFTTAPDEVYIGMINTVGVTLNMHVYHYSAEVA